MTNLPTKGNWGLMAATGGPLGDMVDEEAVPLLGPTELGRPKATVEGALSLS